MTAIVDIVVEVVVNSPMMHVAVVRWQIVHSVAEVVIARIEEMIRSVVLDLVTLYRSHAADISLVVHLHVVQVLSRHVDVGVLT